MVPTHANSRGHFKTPPMTKDLHQPGPFGANTPEPLNDVTASQYPGAAEHRCALWCAAPSAYMRWRVVREGEACVLMTNETLHDRFIELAELPERGRVVDLGCGAGPALAAFARRFPQAHLTGFDRS